MLSALDGSMDPISLWFSLSLFLNLWLRVKSSTRHPSYVDLVAGLATALAAGPFGTSNMPKQQDWLSVGNPARSSSTINIFVPKWFVFFILFFDWLLHFISNLLFPPSLLRLAAAQHDNWVPSLVGKFPLAQTSYFDSCKKIHVLNSILCSKRMNSIPFLTNSKHPLFLCLSLDPNGS